MRYRCHSCGKTFSSYQKKTGEKKSIISLFEKYILDCLTYKNITLLSKLSVFTLRRRFDQLLASSPPSFNLPLQSETEVAYLLVDGLWFGKRFCLMVYRQSKLKLLLYASFMAKEYGSLISKDLEKFKKKGYHFTGVVSDGGTGVRKAVFKTFGHIPHQICLAHTHRQAVNSLGRCPKDNRVKELKKLADHLWLIESKEALKWWKGKLQAWINSNREFTREYRRDDQGHWWYIHKGVRKALRTLVSAPDFCFKFLDHPLMPKTTNEIEGQFSAISKKSLVHIGLKREKIQSFLKWFIYFYNKRILSYRKKKNT